MMQDSDLRDMGYTANLIAFLLEMGGPMTTEQIKRWIAENELVDVTIEDILLQMRKRGIIRLGDARLWWLGDIKGDVSNGIPVQIDSLGRIKVIFVSADHEYQAVVPRQDWEKAGKPVTITISMPEAS